MKRFFKVLIFIAVVVLATSCVKDRHLGDNGPMKEGEAEVLLRLKAPGGYSSSPQTRALSVNDENTLDNIYVLAFDNTGHLSDIRKGVNLNSSTGSSNPAVSGTGSFVVNLKASANSGDTYTLVVLANAEGVLQANSMNEFIEAQHASKSYSDVATLLTEEIDAKMYSGGSAGSRIAMWGEIVDIQIAEGSNTHNVSLTRAVARIDVGVGKASKNATGEFSWTGLDAHDSKIPFELKSVYIIQPSDEYAIMPMAGNFSAGIATAPSVPSGSNKIGTATSIADFRYSDITASMDDGGGNITGSYTTRSIYVPESDILMGIDGAPGDANHTKRMAIVVGGYYNGSNTETFYRIDFTALSAMTSKRELINVLRNHLYQFNISSVSGVGYPDPEAAYNSIETNITVDIYDWNEPDLGDIEFDGTHYFSITDRKVVFAPYGNQTTTVTIKTNVANFEMWELDRGGRTLEMKGDGTGDELTYGPSEKGYSYTLIRQESSSDLYDLTISFNENHVSSSESNRLERWEITVSRIIIRFDVDQHWANPYWYRASFDTPDNWAWRPSQYSMVIGNTTATYNMIFPWNSSNVEFEMLSRIDPIYDDMNSQIEAGILTSGTKYNNGSNEQIFPYNFTFNNNDYSHVGKYNITFKADPAIDATRTDKVIFNFRQGVQHWSRTTVLNSGDIGYKGHTEASPATITVTSNTLWSYSVGGWNPATPTDWLKVRAASEPFDVYTTAKQQDDRLYAPVLYNGAYNGTHTGAGLTKDTPFHLAVAPAVGPIVNAPDNAPEATLIQRTAVVTFANNSFDGTKNGANISNPTITVRQYAPRIYFVSNTGTPALSRFPAVTATEIPTEGGAFTVTANTNLSSWGVRVYSGTDNSGTALVSSAANTTVTNYLTGGNATTASFAVPVNNTSSTRTLSFYFYCTEPGLNDNSAEVKFAEVSQSPNLIAEPGQAAPRIYISGSGSSAKLMLTQDPTNYGAMFMHGVVISWNYFNTSSVDYNPSISGSSDYFGFWNSDAVHSNENLKVGKGDPCRLVGMTVSEIQTALNAGETPDNKQWRMPTSEENITFANDYSDWTALSGVNGRYFSPGNTSGQFLPAAGFIESDGSGLLRGTEGNTSHQIWTRLAKLNYYFFLT